jgi:aminoglycoside 3-N-acetyltransferase
MGVGSGATLLVHSSMDDLARRVPALGALDLIRALQEMVAPGGTLLMPTFPFLGRQAHYADSHRSFDPRRTPSMSGLLTEIFRRLPGVTRSLHPTHAVAGSGHRAEELLSSHHLGTAFGPHSPFYKLQECGGKVVGLGLGLRRGFTILHVAEEMHPRIRSVMFEPEPRPMRIVQDGETLVYELYPLRADLTRDLWTLERDYLADGTLRYTVRGGLLLAVADARTFVQRTLQALDAGTYLSVPSRPPGGRS